MHTAMALGRRDPKRYYEVLNLQPGASPSEVRLAYTFLRNASQSNPRLPMARIQGAYDFLSNHNAVVDLVRCARNASHTGYGQGSISPSCTVFCRFRCHDFKEALQVNITTNEVS